MSLWPLAPFFPLLLQQFRSLAALKCFSSSPPLKYFHSLFISRVESHEAEEAEKPKDFARFAAWESFTHWPADRCDMCGVIEQSSRADNGIEEKTALGVHGECVRETERQAPGPVKSNPSLPQTCFSSQLQYLLTTGSHLNHILLVSCHHEIENGEFWVIIEIMNSLNRSEPCTRQDFAFSFAVNCPAPEWEIMSYFITKPGNSNQESMRLQKVYLLRVGSSTQGHKASKSLPYFLCFSQLFSFQTVFSQSVHKY